MEHEEAFNTLKKAMTTPPVLVFFSEEKDTVLRTDASRRGISGELLQVQEDGTHRPIAYVSRKISNTKGKWSVSELELPAIVYSVNHFRSMLYGKFFEVQSDHSSLQYYKNIKCLTSRLNRLALKLLDYNFKIVHKTGASIRMADLLSRYPLDKELNEEAAAEEIEINVIRCVNIRKLQLEDPFLGRIRQALLDPKSAERRILRSSRLYTLVDVVFHFKVYTCGQAKNILALPETLIDDVLKAYHESLASGAHMGIAKTYNRIREKYFWRNMTADIKKYIRSCLKYQVNKPDRQGPIGLLEPILPSTVPFSEIIIDYLGPLPSSNRKKFILIAMD